ncbi:MAG: hypothetical protein HQM12_17900 [SAR324 cluster bacterium]|nr:hypothetical protein [SAR324 cluster bacterium]
MSEHHNQREAYSDFRLCQNKIRLHPLWPLFASKIDADLLEKHLREGRKGLGELIRQVKAAGFYHPLLFCLPLEEAPMFDQMERLMPAAVESLMRLFLQALAHAGVSGLEDLLELLRQRNHWDHLCALHQLLGKTDFDHLGLLLVELLNYLPSPPDVLVRFFEEFLSSAQLTNLAFTLKLKSSQMGPGLERMLVSLTEFSDFNILRESLGWLDDPALQYNHSLDYAFLLAEYQTRHHATREELIRVRNLLVQGLGWSDDKAEYAQPFAITFFMLRNAATDERVLSMLRVLKYKMETFTRILIQSLLLRYLDQSEESTLECWLRMRDLSLELWGTSQSPQHQLYQQGDFATLLEQCVAQDQLNTFLRLGKYLKRTRRHTTALRVLDMAMRLIARTGSVGLVECLVQLAEQNSPALKPLKQPGRLRHPEQLFQTLEALCTSLFLTRLLESRKRSISLYLNPLARIMEACEDVHVYRAVLRYIEAALDWNLDFDPWINHMASLFQQPVRMNMLIRNWEQTHTDSSIPPELDPRQFTALTLEEVQPFLQEHTMLWGFTPMAPSLNGVPSTDGQTVYLPTQVDHFPDSKTDLYENRNASVYLTHLYHEVGYHILGGSFLADAQPTLMECPNPRLAHNLFNIMEDYRGRQHYFAHPVHPQMSQLLREDEAMTISRILEPSAWKDHFMVLLTCVGVTGWSPGTLNPARQPGEKKLLDQTCVLYLPPTGTKTRKTLGEVLKIVLGQISSLKGKTVAHSLLRVKPLYQLLSQLFGECYHLGGQTDPGEEEGEGEGKDRPVTARSLPMPRVPNLSSGNNPVKDPFRQGGAQIRMLTPMNSRSGKDAFLNSGKGRREEELKTLAGKLQPSHHGQNVPLRLEEQRQEALRKGQLTGALAPIGFDTKPGGKTPQKVAGPVTLVVKRFDPRLKREIPISHHVTFNKELRQHPQYRQFRKDYQHIFHAVEEAVEKLKARSIQFETEGREPDDLVLESLIEAIADPGSVPFLDLYENMVERSHELIPRLEVKILVDISGSTAMSCLAGEFIIAHSQGQTVGEKIKILEKLENKHQEIKNLTVLDVEKIFACAIYRAFELLECDVKLYFFNTVIPAEGILEQMKKDRVKLSEQLEVMKNLDMNPVTTITQTASLDMIGSIQSDGGNEDGVAIRWLTDQFVMYQDHALMILLTDGQPAYEFGVEDTCFAMSQARQKGILLRYINIGGLPEEVLSVFRLYTGNNTVSFSSPRDLIQYAPVFVEQLIEELEGSP